MARSSVHRTAINAPKSKTPELPKWELRACADVDPDIFWDDRDIEADMPNPAAYFTCMRCEIINECLAWALVNEKFGVWGGTTPRMRLKLLRPIERVRCPGCSSNAVEKEPGAERCLSCGLSWRI